MMSHQKMGILSTTLVTCRTLSTELILLGSLSYSDYQNEVGISTEIVHAFSFLEIQVLAKYR